jgi:hypothetical protein
VSCVPEGWRGRLGIDDERVWDAEHPIRHVVRPASTPSRHLVVVFAAFPAAGLGPRYTWYSVLRDRDWNRLFVLDDLGPIGSYYLGARRRLFVADAVAEVIASVAGELGVALGDVVCCGSSKGGWSALYAAFRNGYGHVVAGAPQTKLGTFLLEEFPAVAHVAELVAGGAGPEDRMWLDGLLFDAVDAAAEVPSLALQVGRDDLRQHVEPLLARLDGGDGACELEVADYDEHLGVARHFQPFLLDRVERIVHPT